MTKITITEALAEIKTIGKRIDSKRNIVNSFLARQDGIRDPLEKDGGSAEVLKRERQAIADLEQRLIDIRRGIQTANNETRVTINGNIRSISDWLSWKRDVAPGQRDFLRTLQQSINHIRQQAQSKGNALVSATATSAETKPTDIIVNVDERQIGVDLEALEDTLGQLDGQLSLKNATVFIDID